MMGHTHREILKRLEEEGQESGLSPSFLEFQKGLLTIQSEAEQRLGLMKPALDRKMVDDRVESGIPLINCDELVLDWALLKDTLVQITATFTRHPDLFGELPSGLRELASLPTLKELIRAWLDGASFPAVLNGHGITSYLLTEAIIHATLKPFLVAHCKALLRLVTQKRWRRGYCPICGGKPDFAFLDRGHGARWLACWRCDAEWLFYRLQCPYCGNRSQDTLAYFTDAKGMYRLYVCEECHTYIKAVDLRYTTMNLLLPAERLLTLDMDVEAQEKGYETGYYTARMCSHVSGEYAW